MLPHLPNGLARAVRCLRELPLATGLAHDEIHAVLRLALGGPAVICHASVPSHARRAQALGCLPQLNRGLRKRGRLPRRLVFVVLNCLRLGELLQRNRRVLCQGLRFANRRRGQVQRACLWILLERRAQLLVPPLLRRATPCVSTRLACRVACRVACRSWSRTWYSVSHAGRGGITIGRRSRTQAHTTAAGAVAAALSLRGAARNAENTPSRSTDDASTQPEAAPCTAASRNSGGEVQLSVRRSTCAAEAARSIRSAQLLCRASAQLKAVDRDVRLAISRPPGRSAFPESTESGVCRTSQSQCRTTKNDGRPEAAVAVPVQERPALRFAAGTAVANARASAPCTTRCFCAAQLVGWRGFATRTLVCAAAVLVSGFHPASWCSHLPGLPQPTMATKRTYAEEAAFIEQLNGHSYRCAQELQPRSHVVCWANSRLLQNKDGLRAQHARPVHLLCQPAPSAADVRGARAVCVAR